MVGEVDKEETRHPVVGLSGKEGTDDGQVEEVAKLKKALTVLVDLPYTEVVEATQQQVYTTPTWALKCASRNRSSFCGTAFILASSLDAEDVCGSR